MYPPRNFRLQMVRKAGDIARGTVASAATLTLTASRAKKKWLTRNAEKSKKADSFTTSADAPKIANRAAVKKASRVPR